MQSTRHSCRILNELGFPRQILEKSSTQLMVARRYSANVLKITRFVGFLTGLSLANIY
jgi:hypothetical protein